MTSFTDLGLSAPLLKAIAEAGYEAPTPIQLKAIPPILTGADLLGIAQTGTGKTAAFALPILHRLAADRRPAPRKGARVLILSPTRELATQIAESFKTYGRHLGFTVATVFGGVSERPQIAALARGVDILVATPGRLIDHTEQRNAILSGTEIFVLDEADQMLDLGFFRPIRRIVAQIPVKRQSLFFSATMPKEIEALTTELLRDPVKVAVAPVGTTVERVSQRVIHVEPNKKKALLVDLLADEAMSRTLVFTRTKRGADRVAKHLDGAGIRVAAIHGNKSQNQREAALDAFRTARIRVLVATDIAARGIDIDLVTHVVNFELPEVPEAYVHRIGRTARAGASGIAVSFCGGEERALLRDIERLTRQAIPSVDRRGDATLASDRPAGSQMGLRGGERGEGRRLDGGRADDRGGRQRHADRRNGHGGEQRREAQGSGQRNRTGQRHGTGQRDGESQRHGAGQGKPRRDGARGAQHDSGRHAGAGKPRSEAARHHDGAAGNGDGRRRQQPDGRGGQIAEIAFMAPVGGRPRSPHRDHGGRARRS